MSQSFRAIRSIVTLSLATVGTQPIGWSQDANPAPKIAPVSFSLDSIGTPVTRTGLIRILQEDAATVEERSNAEVIDQGKNLPVGPSLTARKPIELVPLPTPNTNTEGIGTGVRPEDVTIGRLPPTQTLPDGMTRNGSWGLQSKHWVPGGFCHQPLYFEDPMLERHGHVRFSYLQPVASGFRFFGTVPALPYLATLRQPFDEVYTLGAYRPGTAAPVLRYRGHYDPVALRNQFLATAGTAVAVP